MSNTDCKLTLFIADSEPNSLIAKENLANVCGDSKRFDIEYVNVLEDYALALQEKIFVTPALVIRHDSSKIILYGNLSDTEKLTIALGV